jgi:hypothetical protein
LWRTSMSEPVTWQKRLGGDTARGEFECVVYHGVFPRTAGVPDLCDGCCDKVIAWIAREMRGHKPQHIGRADPPRWLQHNGEEDLQVIGHGQDRVRPAPASQELQVLIQQRHAEPHHKSTIGVPRPGQANNSHWHAGLHLHKNRPVSLPRSL